MVDSGIILLKYWLEVSPEEQTRRLESRHRRRPRRSGSSRDMDLKSYSRWYDYSRARDAMFAATDTAWAPWFVARPTTRSAGRLNIISHLLEPDPVHGAEARAVELPKRKAGAKYKGRDLPLTWVPERF